MPGEKAEPFIREVILENFMSYDYGRIPLRGGLNVILGPNGAGKSSILLGISVALGQAYTERSRRLSDLVKRGKDIARVTLLLNNSPRDGKRPLPFRSDLIHLSRYIRKDGTYWFEIDFKEASKIEVTETLSRLGLNPDNMLIIMHQGLGDAFSVISPQEKLNMVEDAVGLSPYRKALLEAKQRLEKIRTEREEREKELEAANIGLMKWKEQYDKYLKFKELKEKVRLLTLEESWAKVARAEMVLDSLQQKLKEAQESIHKLEKKIGEEEEESTDSLKKVHSLIESLAAEERKREEIRQKMVLLHQMKLLAGVAADKNMASQILSALGISSESEMKDQLASADNSVSSQLSELKKRIDDYASIREKLAISRYKLSEMQTELRHLQKQKAEVADELSSLSDEAKRLGARPEKIRALNDIQAEIRVSELQVKEIGEISSDAEKIYNDFRERIQQLSQRIEELDRNKQETLKEVQDRFSVWKRELNALISDLSRRYSEVLSMVGGNGRISIINADDPVNAGLEILVSFRSDQLVPLDAYVQSGGERSTSVAAFLLALQGKVISPFRAVDEFDVHMDRMNRQLFMKSIYEVFRRDSSTQYLLITPVEPDLYDPEANYIMVHKVASTSNVRRVEKVAAAK